MPTPFSTTAKAVAAKQVTRGTDYWTEGAAEKDELQRKYRSIPVPAFLAASQKHINAKTRLELLVEYLGTKNDFTEAFPQVTNQPLGDVLPLVQDWIEAVRTAPPEQQEDAKRSLGGHLKGFGAMIGRGLLKGVTEVLEAPVIASIVDWAPRSGEEAAGALIYNWQRYFQSGEQTFEKNYKAYWKANADKPWFKRGWYSPVTREHGFGVPMGVHLPLEIIFDPLNFLPYGLLSKPIKYGAAYIKLMAKTGDSATSIRYIKRARGLRKAIDARNIVIREGLEAEMEAIKRAADEDIFGAERLAPGAEDVTDIEKPFDPMEFRGAGARRSASSRFLKEDEIPDGASGPNSSNQNGVGYQYEDRVIPDLGLSVSRVTDNWLDDVPTDPGSVEYIDLTEGMPLGSIRDVPNDGLIDQMLKEADPVADEIDEDVIWGLKGLFHSGIRPNELEDIWWDDLYRMFQWDAPVKDPMADMFWLSPSKKVGDKTLRGKDRLLDAEAVDFFYDYAKQLGATPGDPGRAFRHRVTNQPITVKELNDAFKKLAGKYDVDGEKLLSYYSRADGSGNYTYVLRLNKANKTFAAGRDTIDGLETTMNVLGHASPYHTSRYISLFQHNLADGAKSIINMVVDMGGIKGDEALESVTNINNALNKSIRDLNLTHTSGRNIGKLLEADEIPTATIFQATKTGKIRSTKGFVEGSNADLIDELIHTFRTQFLDDHMKKNFKLAFKLPENIDEVAPLVRPAAQYVQGLHQFTTFLLNQIHEKHLIATAEPADMTKLNSAQKTKLAALKKEMNLDAGMLREWIDIITELATTQMKILDPGIEPRLLGGVPAYTDNVTDGVLDELWAPFTHLGSMRMERALQQKKVGVGPGGKGKRMKLTDLDFFKDLIFRNATNKATKKLLTGPKRKAARDAWEALPEEEKQNAFRKGVGYIVSTPKRVGRDLARHIEKGGNAEDTRPRKLLWVVKEWVRDTTTRPDDPHNITGMMIQRLGVDPRKGEQFTLARQEEWLEVPIQDFAKWFADDPLPYPDSMFMTVTGGAKHQRQAHEWANIAFKNNIDINKQYTARALKNMFGIDPASGEANTIVRRMRDNNIIEVVGKSRGGYNQYRFTNDVVRAENDIARGIDNPRFGWGSVDHGKGAQRVSDDGIPTPEAGGGGRAEEPPIRQDPGSPSPMDKLPEGNQHGRAGTWENGEYVEINRVIIQSRAQSQFLKGAGQGGRWSWNPLYLAVKNTPAALQKYMRTVVPGTFAATKAAMVRWRYILAKSQGTHISQQIGHMLEPMYDSLGSTRTLTDKIIGPDPRRTGWGQALKVKFEIDPTTGMAIGWDLDPKMAMSGQTGWRQKDMFRKGGQEDYLRSGTNTKGFSGKGRRMGPLAVMEEEFKRLADESPNIWDTARINKERRKYNHKRSLQDMSTFLGTHRDDLDTFYDLTADQLKWYEWYHQVMPQLYNMLRAEGIDIDSVNSVLKISAKEMRREFVPFLTTEGLLGHAQAPTPMQSLGKAPTQMMEREYYWQIQHKMQNGQGLGRISHEIYDNDPITSLQRTIESYYEYVNQQRFMDEYVKLGVLKGREGQATVVAAKIMDYHNNPGKSLEDIGFDNAQELHAEEFFGTGWARDRGSKYQRELMQDRAKQFQQMQDWSKNLEIQTPAQYAMPDHPLRQTLLPPDASRELMALVEDVVHPMSWYLEKTSHASNMMRVLATGADLGTILLHGFAGLGTMLSPTLMSNQQRFAWARATKMMGQALLMPNVRKAWYASTPLVRDEMGKYNVAFFRSTHTEDLPLPGLFTKGRDPLGTQKPVLKQVARGIEKFWGLGPERLIQAFGFFLDVSKTEMWKAQSAMIKREYGITDDMGKILSPEAAARAGKTQQFAEAEEALTEMAASLNAIHGTLHPAVVGMPQKQRVFESAFLMYAAMYRRASVALIRNMTVMPEGLLEEPGKVFERTTKFGLPALKETGTSKWRRGPALQAASGMLMAGAALGWAINMMGNNDEVFDMGSADFMSARAGNRMRVGMGTPYYTFFRMGRDIFDQMSEDPQGAGKVSWTSNPVIKWGRSMTSPTTSLGIDIFAGRDFIGNPLRDSSGGWELNAIGDRTTRTLIPFWVDTAIDGAFFSKEMSPAGSIPEFFGLRVSPIAPYGQLKTATNIAIITDEDPDLLKWRRSQQAKGLPADATTIPRLLKIALEERTPELLTLKDEVSDDAKRRGSQLRVEQDEYIEKVKFNREGEDMLIDQLTGLSIKFENGELSGKAFREKVDEAERLHRGRMLQLADDYKPVLDTFNERRTGRLNNPEDIFYLDLWYDRYRSDVTGAEGLHDEYGNFDINRFLDAERDFKMALNDAGLGMQAWEYIQARRAQGKTLPGKVGDLDEARKALQPYWSLHTATWGKTRPEYEELIDVWRSLYTQQAKDLWARKNPRIYPLLDRLKMIQEKFRYKNPNIDALLVEFWDYIPITKAGRLVAKKKQAVAGVVVQQLS